MMRYQKIDIVAIVALLLIAGWLRMGQAGITEYKRDEAALSYLALEMAQAGEVPLLGIGSSVGVPNAPVNVWLLALPYAFSTGPLLATQFVGLLNVIAVGLVYGWARRYTGPPVAFTAALLYAVSPWAVMYSRKIWAQSMLPPFVVLTMWAGTAGMIDGRRWGQWLFVPLLVLTGQIHYAAFAIIPPGLVVVGFGAARKHLTRAFWLSLIPAGLLALPYVVGLWGIGLLSPAAVGSLAQGGGGQAADLTLTTEPLGAARILISGVQIHALAGPERFREYLAAVPDVYPLFDVLTVAVVCATLWLGWRATQPPTDRTPVDITLLVWFITPVVAFSLPWTPFYIHYLIPMAPAAFLVLAFAAHDVSEALGTRKRVPMMAAGGLSLIIAGFQVGLWLALLNFVNMRPTPGGFGTPLHQLMEVRTAILAEEPQQVIGSFEGHMVGIDDEPTVWRSLLYDVEQVRFEGRETRVYPANDTVIITDECVGREFHLRDVCYGVYERQSEDIADYDFTLQEGLPFSNGARVLGWRWETQPEACFTLLWGITQPAQQDYTFAVRFVGFDGGVRDSVDALAWSGRYWQPGDRVVQRFCTTVPPDAIDRVLMGMYTFEGETLVNLDLIDVMGNPAAQLMSIDLPDP